MTTDTIRILLVDDSPHFLEAAADFLEAQACLTVVGAVTIGPKALALLHETEPDVILLDINLGDESGLTLIPALRAHRPQVKVIALTLMDEAGYRAAALQAGADAFVTKSNMSSALAALITDLVSAPSRALAPESLPYND